MKTTVCLLNALLACYVSLSSNLFAADLNEKDSCLIKTIQHGPDDLTIKELKSLCQIEEVLDKGLVESRIESERKLIHDPFGIISHRANYLLVGAFNEKGYSANSDQGLYEQEADYDKTEAHFQISFKIPFAIGILDKNLDLYGGYTVRSFWQVYDNEQSSPFRETNHEPEVWFQAYPNWRLFGFKNVLAQFGYTHQSNGKSGINSRSWDRLFINTVFEKKNYAIGVKAWKRLPDKVDDNPDIHDYMGHFELSADYKYNQNELTLMSRNNLESGFKRGAFQLGWSFPLGKWPYLKGFVQYFRGYGESLIDYNKKVDTIGIGILLTD